jgi:hypothetical protein
VNITLRPVVGSVQTRIIVDNQYAGWYTMTDRNDSDEIVYSLNEQFRGNGLMAKVLAKILTNADRDITARVEPENRASRITLKRNGFVKTGEDDVWIFMRWHCPTIADVPTRSLLSALRSYRAHGYDYWTNEPQAIVLKVSHNRREVFTEQELMAELSKRPHIANAREGKVVRRLMATNHMTAPAGRRHPVLGHQVVDAQYPSRRECTPKWARTTGKLYGKSFARLFKVKRRKSGR